jgi:SAM-dependent methyltransferase
MTLSDIDFAQRYRAQVERSNRPRREPSYWDRRAPTMSEGSLGSAYAKQFLARVDLTGCETLLDVGCGPGTIGLSVASQLAHVYGLDYSPGMLAAFCEQAAIRGVANATPLLCAWEDDWSAVPVCDIAIASRATAVRDFEAAALKLASKARRRVYLTYPARGSFVGDDVLRALGRRSEPLPDYLCVVGILHHLGIHPRLDYITDASRFASCAHVEDFVRRMRDYAGELSDHDITTLHEYFARHRHRIAGERMIWAFIWWEVKPSP